MKRFKFSLEKVLEIKGIEEKTIQKNLLLIQNEIMENERNIITLKENISSERKKVSNLSKSISNTTDIMVYYRYIDALSSEVENLNNNLKTLKQKEIVVKNQLIEKSKEKKSLERLKDIQFEEYRNEYIKAQQISIDAISIQNHRFKTSP